MQTATVCHFTVVGGIAVSSTGFTAAQVLHKVPYVLLIIVGKCLIQ